MEVVIISTLGTLPLFAEMLLQERNVVSLQHVVLDDSVVQSKETRNKTNTPHLYFKKLSFDSPTSIKHR